MLHSQPRAPGRTPRARILDAASDLFYREGIRAVGVDRIVAESGVAKMTLYNQFASKEGLVGAWLRRRDGEWMDWLEQDVEARGGGVLSIFDALGAWFARPDFRGCAFINAQAELGRSSPQAAEAIAAHKRRLGAFLRRLLESEGNDDPEVTARELQLLVEGAIVTASIECDTSAATTARRIAQRLLDPKGAI